MNKSIIILFSFTLLIFSCTKEIQIDLKDGEEKIVIEGGVSNTAGPHTIRISKTIGYSKPNNQYPTISGALVIISDDFGQLDTLKESTPGNYVTSKINGIVEHTYKMSVTYNGINYTAQSKMPKKVNYDSLVVSTIPNLQGGADLISVTPVYIDPIELGNYYRAIITINGKQDRDANWFNDDVDNGKVNNFSVITQNEIKKGDTVDVEFQCIDEYVHDFIFTLFSIQNGQSASPANPPTNIKGGSCLGYFSAHTTDTKRVVIPK